MTKKINDTALDPERTRRIYRDIHNSHLFGEFSRLVSIGAYQRIPEFRDIRCVLTTQQKTSLNDALQHELPPSAVSSIEMFIPRLIEHELIMVRTPKIAEIVEEIENFEKRAVECLLILRNLQLTFNSEDQQIAKPTIPIENDTGSLTGPPDAYTAAVNVIRRNLTQPIPAYLELGPLVEVCRALGVRYRARRGPKANSFFAIYFFTLGMCARQAGATLALPSKNSFVRAATDRPTVFLNFARAALCVLRDVGCSLMIEVAVADFELQSVQRSLQAFNDLSDEALSKQLGLASRLKRSGLAELIEAATRGVDLGSTAQAHNPTSTT